MAGRKGKELINAAVFIILEVAALSILYNCSEIQKLWIGQGVTNVKASIWGRTERIRNYFSLRSANEQLTRENSRLMQEMLSLRQDSSRVNAGHHRFTNVRYSMIPANIVTMSRGSQHNYIIIDRGSADGVETDNALVGPNCVAGIIQSVSEHFSLAISFENQDMVISARELRTSLVGSLRWSGTSSDRAIFGDVPVFCDIDLGDTVVTSGFSSMIPPDIPLGKVTGKSVRNGSTAEFDIELFDNLHKIRTLAVVKNLDGKEIGALENEAK